MATDCVIFLKVEFYWFLGSIQLRIVRMALVFDQLSNALLAETGAKRLIKNFKKKQHASRQTTTGKQQQQQVNKQCSISIKEQAGAIGQPFTHICIVDSTGQGRPAISSRPFTARHDGRKHSPSPSRRELCSKTSASMHTTSYSRGWLALAG